MAFRKTTSEKKTSVPVFTTDEKLGIIGERGRSTLELRYGSWNGNEPKYDIRQWWMDADGNERCGKGISFSGEEMEKLLYLLESIDKEES